MKKHGLFILGLLIFAGLAASAPVTSQLKDNNVVVIGTADVGNKYNVTEIKLEKNTEYTIVFVNTQQMGHNLRIDEDGDVSETTVGDDDDLVIGAENNDNENGAGPNQWNATWTTPNEDTEVRYYCGWTGHFADGMYGDFIIGEGNTEESPGFGLILALTSVFVVATVATKFKKQN